MITGTVVIDIRHACHEVDHNDAHRDRCRLAVLERVPDGAHVVIEVGNRDWLYDDALATIRAHGDRLLIEIRGSDPGDITTLVRAAREGTSGVFS